MTFTLARNGELTLENMIFFRNNPNFEPDTVDVVASWTNFEPN